MCDCVSNGSQLCAWLPIRGDLSTTVDSDLLEILHLLHSLPQTQPSDLLSSAEVQWNTKKLYTLELKLNRIAEEQDPYQTLLRHAAHVYTSRALRNLPKGSVVVSQLQQKLAHSLNRLRNAKALRHVSAARLLTILWALLLAQRPHEDGSCLGCDLWSVYILWMLEKLRIIDYEMLLSRLKCIAWVDGFKEVELRSLFS